MHTQAPQWRRGIAAGQDPCHYVVPRGHARDNCQVRNSGLVPTRTQTVHHADPTPPFSPATGPQPGPPPPPPPPPVPVSAGGCSSGATSSSSSGGRSASCAGGWVGERWRVDGWARGVGCVCFMRRAWRHPHAAGSSARPPAHLAPLHLLDICRLYPQQPNHSHTPCHTPNRLTPYPDRRHTCAGPASGSSNNSKKPRRSSRFLMEYLHRSGRWAQCLRPS